MLALTMQAPHAYRTRACVRIAAFIRNCRQLPALEQHSSQCLQDADMSEQMLVRTQVTGSGCSACMQISSVCGRGQPLLRPTSIQHASLISRTLRTAGCSSYTHQGWTDHCHTSKMVRATISERIGFQTFLHGRPRRALTKKRLYVCLQVALWGRKPRLATGAAVPNGGFTDAGERGPDADQKLQLFLQWAVDNG